MVKKKAKEEAAQSIQPKAETSNREESSSNSMAVAAKNEEQPKEEQLKLHVLAADRLNRLVDEANELGITDVVQILSSDKYNQFYMVYRA